MAAVLKRVLIILVVVIVVGVVAGLFITAPQKLASSEFPADYKPNVENGKVIFNAANCSACHQTPGQEDRTLLAGGLKMASPFGTFYTPNISPDKEHGIGNWTEVEFTNAMKRGTGKNGEHLYPAFPYASYSLLKTSDVRDLHAYMLTLPADPTPNKPHEMNFPFNIRLAVGGWKFLYFKPREFVADPKQTDSWNRGMYLTEGPAHCAECHSPRNGLGGMEAGKEYSGAPNLEAGGRFATNITPSKDGIGDWSAQDIADFLTSGTDKCFNEPAGMKEVLASTMNYSPEDALAMGEYLHSLPPRDGNAEHKSC
jgi:mono/diheme cytochrome c family protein